MGRVSTCQKNCKTIDLRGTQVNNITLSRNISLKYMWAYLTKWLIWMFRHLDDFLCREEAYPILE